MIAKIYESKHDYINSQMWYQNILNVEKNNTDALIGMLLATINLCDYEELLQFEELVNEKNLTFIGNYNIKSIISTYKEYKQEIKNFRDVRNAFAPENKFQKHELFKLIKPIFTAEKLKNSNQNINNNIKKLSS